MSPAPATISFEILSPIWRRWWFLTLGAMLVISGVVIVTLTVHRYRMAWLMEIERVRTRIATDLHDDIGSSLSGMAILSEVVKRQIGDSHQEAVPRLADIADTSRGLVDSMSDIVWSVDPRRDDLQSVILRIRQYASDVLETKGIKYDFETPQDLERVKLNPEQRRHRPCL